MAEIQSINDLVGQPSNIRHIAQESAPIIVDHDFDFIAANAPTGMAPGWELRNEADRIRSDETPLVYVREERKKGGHKETITGDDTTPLIEEGDEAVLVDAVPDGEEFEERVTRSASILRENGYEPTAAVSFSPQSYHTAQELLSEGIGLADVSRDVLESDEEPRELEEPDYDRKDSEEVAEMLIDSGAAEIRDLEAGEEPFLYSSGYWGPGYLMVKGLVGQPDVMNDLLWNLANEIHEDEDADSDFVIGNVTGGLIPGWQLRNYMEVLEGEEVPFAYAEGTRLLEEGLVEGDLVGNEANPEIQEGDRALVVEELVNTAGTTTGSALHARNAGYEVANGATIFFYDNQKARYRLDENDLRLVHLTDLPTTLDVAEGKYPERAVDDYRFFVEEGPEAYLEKWNLERVEGGGTK